MSPRVANPQFDTTAVARVYAALAGSPWADAADREAIAQDNHPYTRAAQERIRCVRRYHSAAALKAVTRGIRGVIFGAAGLPADPEPHTSAAVACPDARFVFADVDPIVCKINETILGEDGRVSVCVASMRTPEILFGCPEVAELPAPLHVQWQMCIQFWPPALIRELLPGYARRLPSGSELMMTWTFPSATEGGRRLLQITSDITGTGVYRHTPEAVAGWLDDAGFRLNGAGPADVRGWVPAFAERHRAQAPGRGMGVVARVP